MNWTIKGPRESAHLLTGTGYETAPWRTTGIIIITGSQVSLSKAMYTLQLNTRWPVESKFSYLGE